MNGKYDCARSDGLYKICNISMLQVFAFYGRISGVRARILAVYAPIPAARASDSQFP